MVVRVGYTPLELTRGYYHSWQDYSGSHMIPKQGLSRTRTVNQQNDNKELMQR